MNGCHRLFTAWHGSAMVFRAAVPLLVLSMLVGAAACSHAAEPEFAIEQQPDRLVITCDGEPVAAYVFSDKVIPRPYFTDVHSPGGRQVTRNHPPVEGEDSTDHAELHPGIWLAFGDLSGGTSGATKIASSTKPLSRPPRLVAIEPALQCGIVMKGLTAHRSVRKSAS